MKLGFVGTGTITASIVRGLGQGFAGAIHVSPRNAEFARALAAEFPHVRIAASNQDVVDNSDVVVLAVRPQIATEVLGALKFRPDHHVISLIATASLERLTAAVAPACCVVKAVPLPFVAMGCGPTAVYPPDPVAAELFNRVGHAIEVTRPETFDALTAATATMAPYFAFANAITGWLVEKGIPQSSARQYVGAIFEGLSRTTVGAPETDFLSLAVEHATKGGLNEQLMGRLAEKGAFHALEAGLDEILDRIRATPFK